MALRCHRCGEGEHLDPEPYERLVRDNATGRVYCAWCADELCRIAWGEPATIRHSDGSAFSWKKAQVPQASVDT